MGIFENFAKYELDKNDYLILKEIHKHSKELKKFVTVGFRVLPTGYELYKDDCNIVDFITKHTIYNTQKKALDILKSLQNNTPYLRCVGTLNNGGPSEMCLSPVGVITLYEHENKEIVNYILRGMYFVYNQNPEVRITTIKNRPNTMLMEDLYKQLFKTQIIDFEVFRNIFYGLKEFGYIEGMGGIETLQANELKLTGLGVKYVETLLKNNTKPVVEKAETEPTIVKEDE